MTGKPHHYQKPAAVCSASSSRPSVGYTLIPMDGFRDVNRQASEFLASRGIPWGKKRLAYGKQGGQP